MTGRARVLIRAWLSLLALSALATLAAIYAAPLWPRVSGTAILAAGWMKARIILAEYLGLARAPDWRRGFDMATALAVVILAGLFLAG